jgi:hypothetical protein
LIVRAFYSAVADVRIFNSNFYTGYLLAGRFFYDRDLKARLLRGSRGSCYEGDDNTKDARASSARHWSSRLSAHTPPDGESSTIAVHREPRQH